MAKPTAKKITVKEVITSDEVVISIDGMVTVTGTGLGKFLKEGKTYLVSPILAKTLIKKGAAK